MSFTTGKSAERLGGVPHDTYGMTSLSIRQYVLGLYKQLGLREKDVTKVQTGGPGELTSCDFQGTSDQRCMVQTVILARVRRRVHLMIRPSREHTDEILLSSDKTIVVIDGSGVLADPAGINREELVRLAKLRVPVANFDKSKLSKDGYLVKVEEQDIKLPCT